MLLKEADVAYLKVSFPNHFIARRGCIQSTDRQPLQLRVFYYIVLMIYRERIDLPPAAGALHAVAMRRKPTAWSFSS
jgi:hypothetical protein